jgi:hypothetical protein
MYLLPPKTPFITIIALLAIFAFFVYPIWNFWWIEKSLWRRLFSLFLLAILVFGLGYYVWPVKQEQIPPPKTPLTTKKEEALPTLPKPVQKSKSTTDNKPYLSSFGSGLTIVETNSNKFKIEMPIINIGKHTAYNIKFKFILINNQFQGNPVSGKSSSANDFHPNNNANDHYSVRADIPLPQNVSPLYAVFAIQYQDKESSSKKIFNQIWYYKTTVEWIDATKGAQPPQFFHATLEEKEIILKHLKPLLKEYL